MGGNRYFYDLPVYPLTREQYGKEIEGEIEKVLFPPGASYTARRREMEKINPHATNGMRDHLATKFGAWDFNEIIGFIRLHFLGAQVRGEYFSVSKKRLVRTRTKTLEYQTWKLAPEVDIEAPYGNAEILAAILTYIEDCRREVPRRYIDSSLFNEVARHVDWTAILGIRVPPSR
jgi:hypothetical protein